MTGWTRETLLEPQEHATWREWEVELVDGPRRLLKDADALFAETGHHPSALPSKLARGLGGQYPAGDKPAPGPDPTGPASAVLLSYLRQQVEALKKHDPGVRENAPDAVHQLGWPRAGCDPRWPLSGNLPTPTSPDRCAQNFNGWPAPWAKPGTTR